MGGDRSGVFSLPRVTWGFSFGPSSGVDGAGVHAPVEVRGSNFVADGHAHLLDEPSLQTPLVMDDLRSGLAFHENLNIDGIVPIRAVEPSGDRILVLSHAFAGQTLSELLGALEISDRAACEIAVQIADSLDQLHHAARDERGPSLVHGGVDLDHVLISATGNVALREAGLSDLLRTRNVDAVDGGFVAPESRGGGRGSEPADVYGVAMVLLSCLAGRPPKAFPSNARAHRQALEEALSKLPDLDVELDRILRSSLSEVPANRPSAAAFPMRSARS